MWCVLWARRHSLEIKSLGSRISSLDCTDQGSRLRCESSWRDRKWRTYIIKPTSYNLHGTFYQNVMTRSINHLFKTLTSGHMRYIGFAKRNLPCTGVGKRDVTLRGFWICICCPSPLGRWGFSWGMSFEQPIHSRAEGSCDRSVCWKTGA